MAPGALRLRRAAATDVGAIADLYLRSRKASVPAIPPGVHSNETVRTWFTTTVYPRTRERADHELWVAVERRGGSGSGGVSHSGGGSDFGDVGGSDSGDVVALMALDGDWIGHLYVDPSHTGKRIGTALVDLAKARRPQGLELWAFESNVGARRFYVRHGFVAVEHTDGTGNEEGAPDVRYRWQPAGNPRDNTP